MVLKEIKYKIIYIKNFMGKLNKTQYLEYLYYNDNNLSSNDKGWIKQEINKNIIKKNKYIRNPPGKQLAHERGREKAKGYGYEHSQLQLARNHKIQHKYDNMGKKNKERPYDVKLL